MADETPKGPYRPTFLTPDEMGKPEVSQSVDVPISERQVKPKAADCLKYQARLGDLRLLAPYRAELEKRLGQNVHVLQFKSPFSVDHVPGEYKHKELPLLVRVKGPGFLGFLTDKNPKTFYFSKQEHADSFLQMWDGAESDSSLEEELESRDRLHKLLW